MRATFLHMADCHLGYRQYNSRERQNDFTRAYLEIVGIAIEKKVDFVLLAGDLFERRAIDPITLSHAITGLERLKGAGIPCLAVEGNHELAYYRD
ncbi:MAG: DNA repair exonuclease, partial [Caldilineaceae bacterium]|nr:DNA repair exonuclease [Caldilineaceae bacterium]